jgi:thiamine kinase-like enzyme
MLFQEGEHKNNLSHSELLRLIETVKKLHAYDIYIDDDITTVLCRYELVKYPTQAVNDALDIIDDYNIDYVLCHNDLNAKNILWDENKVVFLDFEYTAVNDCYFDLASISVEFNLSEKEEIEMLDIYFGNEFYDEAKLEAYKVIYKALCDEWFKENS